MFEGLLSCLMLERPDDPVNYIEKKMAEIKAIGLDNVNWETFVFHIHPYRDGIRRTLVHDGSKYDKERENEDKAKEALESERSKAESRPASEYKPEVFQLTEAQ